MIFNKSEREFEEKTMDSNTTFEDEFMTDQEVMIEFGTSISGDEFMTDQEVMAEFGPKPSDDVFTTDSEVSEDSGGILDSLEVVVEKAESGDAKDALEEPSSLSESESDAVSDVPIVSGDTATQDTDKGKKSTIGIYSVPNTAKIEKREKNSNVEKAHIEANEARAKFLATKRRLGFISLEEYPEVVAVKSAISKLTNLLVEEVPVNDVDYAFKLESICLAYNDLMEACLRYEDFSKTLKKLSKKEETWLDLAQQIYKQSGDELGKFKLIKGDYAREIRVDGDIWADILYTARQDKLGHWVGGTGGQSSDVHIFEKKGKKSFLKYEDRVLRSKDEAEIAGGKKKIEFTVATGDAKVEPGMTVSDRNVSTSRAAEKLGLGEIVAQSKTVLTPDKDGNLVRANLMEGVTGKNALTMADLIERVKKYQGTEFFGKKITFSGKAVRQMFELQILDLICGQVDRNPGNYFVFFEINDNQIRINGIKAIDNDLSFGLMKVDQSVGKLVAISDWDGKDEIPTIPFISRDLYEALMMPGLDLVFKYDQIDLRTDSEIQAMLERYTFIRNKIQDFCKRGLIEIIDDDEEFEQRYKQTMIDRQNNGTLATGFFAKLIKFTIARPDIGNFLS